MAKSIKLGSDTYLDASGIVGTKGRIASGDLNDYKGQEYSGYYYVNADSTHPVSNLPTGVSTHYGGLLVVCQTTTTTQMLFYTGNIYVRSYVGSPAAWSDWFRFHGSPAPGYNGRLIVDESQAAVSIASGGWHTIDEITFETNGTYIVKYVAQFQSNATGNRGISLHTARDAAGTLARTVIQPTTPSNVTNIATLDVVYITDAPTTMYINATQNSGSALNVTPRYKLIQV